MGQLIYGVQAEVVSMDDRALAHLRVVMLAKLRRRESFAFNGEYDTGDGPGRITMWMSTGIPLVWKFSNAEQHTIDRAWLDALMVSANSAEGLRLVPEPEKSGS